MAANSGGMREVWMHGKPTFLFWCLRILGPTLLVWLGIVALDLTYSKVTPGFGIDPFRIAAAIYPAAYFDALTARRNWLKTWRLWFGLWTLVWSHMVWLFVVAGGVGVGAMLYSVLGLVFELPELRIAEGIVGSAWLLQEPHRSAFLTTIFLGLPLAGFLAGLLLGRLQRSISPTARRRDVILANGLGLAIALPGLAVFLPLFASGLDPIEQYLFGALVVGLAFLPHLALTWYVYEIPDPRKGTPRIVRTVKQNQPLLGMLVAGTIISLFWH